MGVHEAPVSVAPIESLSRGQDLEGELSDQRQVAIRRVARYALFEWRWTVVGQVTCDAKSPQRC
jgi:hypothetical protein